MKNGLLSILCIFSSLITSAQVSNSLTIDLSDPGKIQPVNVAVNKPLTVVVINCKSGLHDNLTLEVKNGSAQLPSVKLDCKKGTSIPMDKIFEKKDTASLHLTLNTDLRVKNDRKVHIELTITPQGALTPALQDVQQPVVATPGKGGDTAGLSK
ncbi:MAG TPA: hypothetical protein VHC96_03520, partial [Puia sp.]|nr:hypothetical protein [Puia sp.]